MKPIEFDGVNVVYGKGQPEYQPLPAELRGDPVYGELLTCWELSPEELQKIAETGKIWLSLLTFGKPLQPVLLSVDSPRYIKKTRTQKNKSMNLKQFFSNERLLHAGACFVLTVIIAALLWFSNLGILYGALLAIGVCIGKEIRDVIKGGYFDLDDFWADLIGALMAAVCLCLIKWPLW